MTAHRMKRWPVEHQRAVAALVIQSIQGDREQATEDEISALFFKLQRNIITNPEDFRGIGNWASIRNWLVPAVRHDKPIGKMPKEVKEVKEDHFQYGVMRARIAKLEQSNTKLEEMINLILKEGIHALLPIYGVNIIRNGGIVIDNVDIMVAEQPKVVEVVVSASEEEEADRKALAKANTIPPVPAYKTGQFIKPSAPVSMSRKEMAEEVNGFKPPVVKTTKEIVPSRERENITIVGVIQAHAAELKREYEGIVNLKLFDQRDTVTTIANYCKGKEVIIVTTHVNHGVMKTLKSTEGCKVHLFKSASIKALKAKIDELLKQRSSQ